MATNICDASMESKQIYGAKISHEVYDSRVVILPNEIRSVSRYLSLGGQMKSLEALAHVGFLMENLHSYAHEDVVRTAAKCWGKRIYSAFLPTAQRTGMAVWHNTANGWHPPIYCSKISAGGIAMNNREMIGKIHNTIYHQIQKSGGGGMTRWTIWNVSAKWTSPRCPL